MAVGREARRPGILASFFRLDSHAPRKVKVQRRVSRLAEGPRPFDAGATLSAATRTASKYSVRPPSQCLEAGEVSLEAATPGQSGRRGRTTDSLPCPKATRPRLHGKLARLGGAGCVFGAPLQPRRQSATGCSGKRDLDGSGRDWEQAKQRQGLPLVQRRCCQIGVALHSGGRARGGTRTPAGARACLPVREPLTRCRFLVPQVVILPRARSAHALLVRYRSNLLLVFGNLPAAFHASHRRELWYYL